MHMDQCLNLKKTVRGFVTAEVQQGAPISTTCTYGVHAPAPRMDTGWNFNMQM